MMSTHFQRQDARSDDIGVGAEDQLFQPRRSGLW